MGYRERKTNKLLHYLSQGKVVSGAAAMPEVDGRPTAAIVALRRVAAGYAVDIEVFFDGNDVQNLREDTSTFATLALACAYIEAQTGLQFNQLGR